MKRLLVTAVVVPWLLVGCDGNDGDDTEVSKTSTRATTTATTTEPEQDADDFMKELVQQSVRGQYGRAWETLHPAHQAVVSRERYDTCESENDESLGATKINVAVVDTYEEPVRIEGEGLTDSTAVTLRFTYNNPLTGKPAEEHATVHAVAIDGEWKWILTPKDYAAYNGGRCPPD